MKNKISNLEFRRRYFNDVLCESFAELHHRCIETHPSESEYEACKNAAKEFFKDELNLANNTIESTKKAILPTATYFAKTVVEAAEELANDKMEEILKNKDLPIPEDPKMSDEDKTIMDAVFTAKCPEDEIESIRNATASALYAENRKSDEIKEALSIVSADAPKETLQESVSAISQIGPTSLMHAIIANTTEHMLKNCINESSGTPSELIKRYSDDIKRDSMVMYSLYECINCFGFKTYTSNDVENIARDIYLDK